MRRYNARMNDENLSGAGLSAKDILVEVRRDIKDMSKNVDILVSQNLDGRLKAVESWKDQLTGKIVVVSAGIALAISVFGPAVGKTVTDFLGTK